MPSDVGAHLAEADVFVDVVGEPAQQVARGALARSRRRGKRRLDRLRTMSGRILVVCVAPDSAGRILELVQEHR